MTLKSLKVSFKRQHDQADCGAACLASVVGFHGGIASIDEIRRLSGTTKPAPACSDCFNAHDQWVLIPRVLKRSQLRI